MKKLTVLFSVFFLALFFSFSSTTFLSAKTVKPLQTDIKSCIFKSGEIQKSKTIAD